MLKHGAYILILVVLALISLGMVMLTSVGAFVPANQGDAFYFVTRQSVFLVIGIAACLLAAHWDYQYWLKYSWYMVGAAALLMLACFLPGVGVRMNDANRWLNLGLVTVQPVEVAKFSLIAALALWLGAKQKTVHTFQDGVLVPGLMLGGMIGLCALQKDLGTSALMVLIVSLMMFIAGVRISYLAPIPILGIAAVIVLAIIDPEKLDRLMAFLDPEAHRQDGGWQIFMALIAFGSGGVSGMGLGNSVQKFFYLPEAQTDCIFPIIGEELGLIVTLLVVLCFLLFALSAGHISCHAPEPTGVLLGFGVTAFICLQGAMNMAVVTSLMPAKGIGLPFISYGGSNLIMCLIAVGILLNIHRQADYAQKKERRVLPPIASQRM